MRELPVLSWIRGVALNVIITRIASFYLFFILLWLVLNWGFIIITMQFLFSFTIYSTIALLLLFLLTIFLLESLAEIVFMVSLINLMNGRRTTLSSKSAKREELPSSWNVCRGLMKVSLSNFSPLGPQEG